MRSKKIDRGTAWLGLRPVLAILVILLLGSGCASRPPLPVKVLPAEEGERLLSVVARHTELYRSLNGLARVRGEVGGQSFSVSQGILAASPAKLRLETLGPFGQSLVTVATDGQVMEAMVPSRKRFWRGPAGADNVREFLHLPMELKDLVNLLLYRVPLQPFSSTLVEFDPVGEYRLTLFGPVGRRQVLLFDVESRLTGSAWYEGDELRTRIGFADFQEGTNFPLAIFSEIPFRNQEFRVTFSELRINPDIPAASFRIEPLSGMTVRTFPEDPSAGSFNPGE